MNKITFLIIILVFLLTACEPSQLAMEQAVVESQQEQYSIAQPVPLYDWSLERDLLIQLYNIRNDRVSTHSVWRSDFGMIEGDCPSMGYGIPYDTSLTNPWMAYYRYSSSSSSGVAVNQAEPNGVFSSTNTSATWVMCLNNSGLIEPHYVESKVTVYPYTIIVDYENDLVVRSGESSVTIDNSR